MRLTTEDRTFLGRVLYMHEQETRQPWEPGQLVYPSWWQEFDKLDEAEQVRYCEVAEGLVRNYEQMKHSKQYRLNCSYCGRFVPKSAVNPDHSYDAPSGAANWTCPHCGGFDGNY